MGEINKRTAHRAKLNYQIYQIGYATPPTCNLSIGHRRGGRSFSILQLGESDQP
jgi:hypothetical protein